ncbi:glycosyl transferase group 1 [Microbacterium laevaniformans OR221]|nr:glycosyl transferase group 1 [Microbacterium laevaniformans OR221]
MRITHVASSLCTPLGGAEAYCVRLAIEQSKQGHRVSVATPWIDEDTRSELSREGVEVLLRPVWRPYRPDQRGTSMPRKVLFHSLDLVAAFFRPAGYGLAALKSDILHVHRFQGIGASILRSGHRRKVVHTVHDFSLVDSQATTVRNGVDSFGWVQRARSRILLRAARRADLLLFPSERTLSRHRDRGLRPSSNVRVAPLGWSLDVVDDVSVNRGQFVFLGKLTHSKGIDVALEAWELASLGDHASFVVAGDGELREEVASAGNGVQFRGWVDGEEKARLIRGAWAIIFPSQWPENYPLTVAEAMIAGVPVITNERAAGPLAKDGATALVTSSPDAPALALALRLLYNSPTLRNDLAAEALKIGNGIDMPTHTQRIEQLYREVLYK